ncbi:UNVERIFIED_CONTAM: hypothetical protein ABID98_002651 [Brevibacillus sp. OAP136]
MIKLTEEYKKRAVRFLELWNHSGWSLKMYGIAYEGEFPRQRLVDAAKEFAQKHLPEVAGTDRHYGVGFIGVHDGHGGSFIFIDWWSDENELNHHVYVASHESPDSFTYMTPHGLIACVWDLKILSFEREAWLQCVLNNPEGPNLEDYLAARLNEDV